jgi:hypothetical protein
MSVHVKRFDDAQAVEVAVRVMPPGLDHNVSKDAPGYITPKARNGVAVPKSPTALEDKRSLTHATEEPAMASTVEEDWILHLLSLPA